MKRDNCDLNSRRHAREVEQCVGSFNNVFGSKINNALGRLKPNLAKIEQNIDDLLQIFKNHEEEECDSFVDLIDMFLNYAIDHKTMVRNIQSLVDAANNQGIVNLVFILLPTYFTDVGQLSEKALSTFLVCCKNYYQGLCQEIALPKEMHVSIAIPLYKYFDNFISSQGTHNPESPIVCIANIMCNTIIERDKEYFFMNQDQDENRQLCTYFKNEYNLSIHSVSFETYDNYGNLAGKKFTPYVVKNDILEACDHDLNKEKARESQLLTFKLFDYLHKNIFTEVEEI